MAALLSEVEALLADMALLDRRVSILETTEAVLP